MKKLYEARLFRLMLEDEKTKKYEAYSIGTVIVSRKGKKCKEFLYGVDIPVFDSKIGHINGMGEHVGSYYVNFSDEKKVNSEYMILREDLTDKNVMTTKDMIKFDFDGYASFTMSLVQREEEQKRLFKCKNGVVYGKSIGRG